MLGERFWEHVDQLVEPYDVIHLRKQCENTLSHLDLCGEGEKTQVHARAFRATLNTSWRDFYEGRVKKRLRADSRRQRRRLAEIGEVHFVSADDEATRKNTIAAMIRQKSRRFRETGARDMFTVPEHRHFYMGLADIPPERLRVHCSALRVGETVVATHVGVADDETYYYLMPSHEAGGWERFSPGRLLLEHLIEWSINNNFKVFDFTVGSEPYKKDWCDEELLLFETVLARTPIGRLYALAHRGKSRMRGNSWILAGMRRVFKWR
ncbi:GNAT family N-acetyltransferase [Gemmatimonadota bacterium]